MSGIPLEYWTGLGAVPAGRADPAACQQLVNAKAYYDALKAARVCSEEGKRTRPGDCNKLTNAYSQWNALKAARACRDAPAPAAPAAAPRPADGPGRIQVPTAPTPAPTKVVLPTYTIPQRGAFGIQSRLEPVSSMFRPQQPQAQPGGQALLVGDVPTWIKVAGGLALAGVAVALAINLASRGERE